MMKLVKQLYSLNVLVILVALLAIDLGMHAPLLITGYFGEQDAARIANGSITAAYRGGFAKSEYAVYSCPLYGDVLRFFLETGVISISDIPFWMAFVSLISSAIVTVMMFVFVFRLTISVSAALGASLILQLIPVFWFNSLYGFSSIVALAFFMVSVVLFQSALSDRLSRYTYPLLFGASILFVLAVMTKIDVLLASAIYCLPVWRSDRSLNTKLIWIGCLALFSGFVFLLHDQYAEALITTSEATAFNWDAFNSAFPAQFTTFLSRKNLAIMARAVGILNIPTALIGLALIGWRREWNSAVFWLALSGLPLALFWGMRPGNSARHNLIPGVFLCIILVLPLMMHAWRKWAWAGFLCVVCLTNFFYYTPSANTVSPSGRLLFSTHLVSKKAKDLHATGKRIAHLPYGKVAIIGQGWKHPYFRFEVLRSSQLTYVKHGADTLEMQNENRNQSFLWLYREPEISEVVVLAERGYFLVIANKEMAEKLSHLAELQGKWVPLDHLEPV
jgi:hypothetical protein